jgi:hypothetical protein
MDTTAASNQTSPVGKLANYPVLQRLRRALRHQLTRVWPTRYQALLAAMEDCAHFGDIECFPRVAQESSMYRLEG